jgi:hypothetical protein
MSTFIKVGDWLLRLATLNPLLTEFLGFAFFSSSIEFSTAITAFFLIVSLAVLCFAPRSLVKTRWIGMSVLFVAGHSIYAILSALSSSSPPAQSAYVNLVYAAIWTVFLVAQQRLVKKNTANTAA